MALVTFPHKIDRFIGLVEQLMESNETGAFHIPMGSLQLELKINGRCKTQVHQSVHFRSFNQREIVARLV